MSRRRKTRHRAGGRSQQAAALHRRGWRRLPKAVLAFAAGLGLLIVCVLVIYPAAGSPLGSLPGTGSGSSPTAAIVDQLSLTVPNPAFVERATETLEEAGYSVDYYPGEEVRVEFYRTLPTHGYDLIIFRVHSGLVEETDVRTGEETQQDYVALFTAEPYSETKYASERVGRLGAATYFEGGEHYFSIAPGFITSSMIGEFDDAIILLMGCDGLRSTLTADAFLQKGAKAVVSWDETVTAGHTDEATERFLEKLLIDNIPAPEAVAQTAAEVGPDPVYGANLLYYP